MDVLNDGLTRGCGTALVTPFRQDGSLDEQALYALAQWQVESGIDWLVACGTTAETPTLSDDEWLQVLRIITEAVAGRIPVWAGCTHNATKQAAEKAKLAARIPGVTAIFAASGDLGNFSGYKQGTPDYERLINVVHDAAIGAGKRLCGPFAWRDRPDFTCFQNASETAAIARGVAAELGPLKDTQGKPEVGPYAPQK